MFFIFKLSVDLNVKFYFRQDIEKELELQIGMKQEMEMALRILEKDIHEKQDTMISLRKQLEEIKAINLEMYQKLQVKFPDNSQCMIIVDKQ